MAALGAKLRSVAGGRRDDTDDIAAVMFFLRGAAAEELMFNTHRGREAFDAFCRILDVPPDDVWDRTGEVA
jgi:hypothetical protein